MSGPATVHICVVGDDGVGKTSLITAAATETFPDHPPPVLPPAKLPADTTPEQVPVVITDTSSRPEDKQTLELACQVRAAAGRWRAAAACSAGTATAGPSAAPYPHLHVPTLHTLATTGGVCDRAVLLYGQAGHAAPSVLVLDARTAPPGAPPAAAALADLGALLRAEGRSSWLPACRLPPPTRRASPPCTLPCLPNNHRLLQGVHVPVMLVGCKSDVRPADRSLHEVRLAAAPPTCRHARSPDRNRTP